MGLLTFPLRAVPIPRKCVFKVLYQIVHQSHSACIRSLSRTWYSLALLCQPRGCWGRSYMNWIMDIAWTPLLSVCSQFLCTDLPVSSSICNARIFVRRRVLANSYFWYSFVMYSFMHLTYFSSFCSPLFIWPLHIYPKTFRATKEMCLKHTHPLCGNNIVYTCVKHTVTSLWHITLWVRLMRGFYTYILNSWIYKCLVWVKKKIF